MRFHGIKAFLFSTDAFTTLKSISTNEESTLLYDAGDIDKDEVFVGEGVTRNSFTITLADAIQAEAIKNHAPGTITFRGANSIDGDAVVVTMTNCKVSSRSGSMAHSQVGMITLNGRADNITMTAPP